jgi:hypothetical protein
MNSAPRVLILCRLDFVVCRRIIAQAFGATAFEFRLKKTAQSDIIDSPYAPSP